MKKSFIIIVAAIAMMFAGNKLSAQTSIGFYQGSRAYVQNIENADDKSNYGAYAFGISFEQNARLGKILGLSLGADLGLAAKNDYLVDTPDATLLESYLDIPIRAKIYIPLGSAVDFNIFAGGVPSFCLSSNTKVGDADPIKNLSEDGYQSFDVMIGGGVGLEIIDHIKLALSFDIGVFDRNKSDLIEMHSGALKFTAAYMF